MKEFVEKLLNELNYQKEYNQIVYDAKPRTEHEKDLNAVLQSTYDSAIRIVKRLVGEYERKNLIGWIPCSERLPEKNGMYLVTQKRYSLDTRRMIGIETDYVQFSCGEWCRARFLEVIAWQPLPEPYQPKGE